MSAINAFHTQGLSLTVQGAPTASAEAEQTVAKFMKYMDAAKDGPGGFMRLQILASMNLTEADVAAMTPEDREKLERKIEEIIRQKIEEAAKEKAVKEKLDAAGIDLPRSGISVHKMDVKLDAKKLSDDEIAAMESVWKQQFLVPVGKPDNHADNVYATVKINGKIVATLYNSGGAETSNMAYSKLKNLPSMGVDELAVGPELAQKRAEEIAAALGGSVVKNDTAMTQQAWRALPPVEWTYDYDAMEKAQAIREEAIEARRHASPLWLDAQLLGQQDS